MNKFVSKLSFIVLLSVNLAWPLATFGADEDVEYFKQFIYVEEIDDTDPDFPESSHHFVMTKWDHRIPTSTSTQYLTQTFTLYMLEDGTYKAYYRENLHTVGSDGFLPRGCRVIEGTWSVPDTKLVLTWKGRPLLEADRFVDGGQHAMMFTFVESIIAPELKGQKISAGAAQGTGMNDHFCF